MHPHHARSATDGGEFNAGSTAKIAGTRGVAELSVGGYGPDLPRAGGEGFVHACRGSLIDDDGRAGTNWHRHTFIERGGRIRNRNEDERWKADRKVAILL